MTHFANLIGQISAPTEPRGSLRGRFQGPARLSWTARTRIGFSCHWLREVSGNLIRGDYGMRLEASLEAAIRLRLEGRLETVLEPLDDGQARLQVLLADPRAARISCQANCDVIPERFPEGLVSLAAGEIPAEAAGPLWEAILAAVPAAVERHWTAEIGRRLATVQDPAVVLEQVLGGAAEAEAARQALGGGEWLPGQSGGLFAAAEETLLQVHLPFFDKKRWLGRAEAFAGCTAQAGEWGRIEVSLPEHAAEATHRHHGQTLFILSEGLTGGHWARSAGGFRLSTADTRTLPRQSLPAILAPVAAAYAFGRSVNDLCGSLPESWNDVEVSLTLSLPGEAGTAWFELPQERSPAHADVFRHLSRRVQAALRRWLPYLYLCDVSRFEQKETAIPVLVYQAGKPFYRKLGREFTYDPINPSSFQLALRKSSSALPSRLAAVRRMLAEGGMDHLAEAYHPKLAPRILRKLRRVNRQFQNLLAADELFIDHFLALGNRARELKDEVTGGEAPRFLLRVVLELTKGLHPKLRRLYAGQDMTVLAPILLIEATSALNAVLGRPAPIEAVLRIASSGGGAQVVLHGCSEPIRGKPV